MCVIEPRLTALRSQQSNNPFAHLNDSSDDEGFQPAKTTTKKDTAPKKPARKPQTAAAPAGGAQSTDSPR